MRLKIVVTLSALLALALPLSAVSIPKVEGYVSYPDYTVEPNAHVKICNVNGQCWGGITDIFGRYQILYANAPEYTMVTFYAWTDTPRGGRTGQWGSPDDVYSNGYVCQGGTQFNPCENYGYFLNVVLLPRPFAPQLLSPADGASNVPLNGLVLNFTDGSDAWRQPYQIVYDIYASGYGIQPRLYASNVPCNGRGQCSYYVPSTLEPATFYRWYVKAKLVFAYNSFLTRDSSIFSFTSAGTSTMTFSFRTYYSRYLSAQYGGGGNVNAIPTYIGDYEKFKIIDLNGGDLLNGEQVWLTAPNGMYVSAVGGGGAGVVANVLNPTANETFTIVKMNNGGAGTIVSGDNIALRGWNGYYVVAEGGGGGDVNCNRSVAAQWETFGLSVNP
jgi:hypothetical protein